MSTEGKKDIFSQETIDSLVELGIILKGIYVRMKKEGYEIIDGKVIHVATGKPYDSTTIKPYRQY